MNILSPKAKQILKDYKGYKPSSERFSSLDEYLNSSREESPKKKNEKQKEQRSSLIKRHYKGKHIPSPRVKMILKDYKGYKPSSERFSSHDEYRNTPKREKEKSKKKQRKSPKKK